MSGKIKIFISQRETFNKENKVYTPEEFLGGKFIPHEFPQNEIFIDKLQSSHQFHNLLTYLDSIGRSFYVDHRNFTEALSPPHKNGFIQFRNKQSRKSSIAIKRVIDVILSISALLLLSPILILIALLIKLSSSGPVLFQQIRIGLNGKKFTMFKFRSMVENADEIRDHFITLNKRSGPTFKIDNDPRVTPIGNFIRKHSIDELPQLINILLGDMSIVGPRPPLPEEFEKYSTWQIRRLSVTPGLTCYWQILREKNIDFSQWVKLDLKYIDNWSIWNDAIIILKTIPEVIIGRRSN